jgi:deoxyribodipyrimidine photo-lyase
METSLKHIFSKLENIDPIKYSSDRNFIDGSVSYLSPFISRGVISTKQVLKFLIDKGYSFSQMEKFVQELAWRDYWQNIWVEKGDLIDSDLKKPQNNVLSYSVPNFLLESSSSIEAIDNALQNFYNTGYIHNHFRMYIASIVCNIGKYHWKNSAKWMYYHLLDGDWASNSLSWQWVCGTNSNKLYYANQDNINKYSYSNQKNTFLDVDYQEFASLPVPNPLLNSINLDLKTPLPKSSSSIIIKSGPIFIYNYYNLDPNWQSEKEANRILLLEPSIFEKYPVSQKSIDFVLSLSKNIKDIQLFVGSFEQLQKLTNGNEIFFKEHPLNNHYKGTQLERDWMFNVKGYYSSFFKFWNKAKKEFFKNKACI